MGAVVVERAPVVRRPELVGLVAASLHPQIRRVADGLGLTLELSDVAGLVAARIEGRCPEIVLVDADMGGCPCAVSRARCVRT